MFDPRREPGRLAVVIPAYNAERHLGAVLDALLALVPAADIWVVDDGSSDGTAAAARAHGVRVVRQEPNQGKSAALRRGFAETAGYEWVATLDADGQHAPADLPRLVAAAEDADLVVGCRALAGRMPPLRRAGNALSSRLVSALAGQRVADSQSGYRLHRRALLDRLLPLLGSASGYLLETEILVLAARQGFRLAGVPIPTVYADETSHFRPLQQLPRFLSLFGRLLWAVASGRAARAPRAAAPRPPDKTPEGRWSS